MQTGTTTVRDREPLSPSMSVEESLATADQSGIGRHALELGVVLHASRNRIVAERSESGV